MILIFLGLFGGLFHVANSQVQAFERSAARDISSKLHGGNRSVSVRASVGPEAVWGDICSVSIDASHFSADGLPLYTESNRSHKGLVRMLHMDLEDFSIRDLHVSQLKADIPDCRFDFPLAIDHRRIRLSKSGRGAGEVVVGEHDLESFILAKFPEVKRVTVKIEKDKIFVDGFGEFLIVQTNFSVIATLESTDGNALLLSHARVLFDGHVADNASRDAVLGTLNPVVDLNKDLSLFDAIKIEHVVLRNGQLKVSGQLSIPELPKEK